MAKDYKSASPKEKYDSAMKKNAEDKKEYSALDTLRKLVMPKETAAPVPPTPAPGLPQGPGMKKGGKVGSASKRADGIAQRGKTRGKIC